MCRLLVSYSGQCGRISRDLCLTNLLMLNFHPLIFSIFLYLNFRRKGLFHNLETNNSCSVLNVLGLRQWRCGSWWRHRELCYDVLFGVKYGGFNSSSGILVVAVIPLLWTGYLRNALKDFSQFVRRIHIVVCLWCLMVELCFQVVCPSICCKYCRNRAGWWSNGWHCCLSVRKSGVQI